MYNWWKPGGNHPPNVKTHQNLWCTTSALHQIHQKIGAGWEKTLTYLKPRASLHQKKLMVGSWKTRTGRLFLPKNAIFSGQSS